MDTEEDLYTAVSRFLSSLEMSDTQYEEKEVARQLPFAGETYDSFSALEDAVEEYAPESQDFEEDITRRELSHLFDESVGPVTASYMDDGELVSESQYSPEKAWKDAYNVSDWFEEDVPPHSKQRSYPWMPLTIDASEDTLEYSVLLVSAENRGLGCTNAERALKLPAKAVMYTGTVNTLADPETFVKSLEDDDADPTASSYNKYAATMERLEDDDVLLRDIQRMAEQYRMARDDVLREAFFRDVPETVQERREQEIVSRVAALASDDEDGFSYETVAQKLEGNLALFNQLLDIDEDGVFDLEEDPLDQYITDHPDTTIISSLPGTSRDGRQFLSLFRPDQEPEQTLVEEVARCIALEEDVGTAFDRYIHRANKRLQEQREPDTEPDHIDRTYQ